MSNPSDHSRLLHGFAVATACVAMLPIAVGALVTTVEAGMAFPDWPSSDGQNMLMYPWLKSAGDEFIEHGHRLAGVVIGLFAIGLTAIVWAVEQRRWVRVLGTLVLVGVVLQGLLGGMRVLRNSDVLAMIHGNLAAWVFSLVSVVALVTSRGWRQVTTNRVTSDSSHLRSLAIATAIIVFVQYTLGGMIRHLGTALHEHLFFAAIALLAVILTTVAAFRSGSAWLRPSAVAMLAFVLVQGMLGAGAWVTKFGFASAGYVAIQHSTLQVTVRTLHTIVGMLLFMTTIVHAIRVCRVTARQPLIQPEQYSPLALTVEGGAG